MKRIMPLFRVRQVLVTGLIWFFCLNARAEITLSGNIQWDGNVARYLDEPAPFYAEGNLARRPGAKAIAKDVIPEYSAHAIEHLNDGIYGNDHSWIGNSADCWAGLHLGVPTRLTAFAFSRNNTCGELPDRFLGTYRVQYTQSAQVGAGSNWKDIGAVTYSGFDLSLSRRHRFTLSPAVEATGFRIIAPPGACIDEIELYDATPSGLSSPWLTSGHFGQALSLGLGAPHWGEARLEPVYQQRPLTVEAWVKLNSAADSNIIVAAGFEEFAGCWVLGSDAKTGNLLAYLPGSSPTTVNTGHGIVDGQWHYVAMVLETAQVRLYIDGVQRADAVLSPGSLPAAGTLPWNQPGGLYIGAYPPGHQGCDGLVDEVRISGQLLSISGIPTAPFQTGPSTIGLWHFDQFTNGGFSDSSAMANAATLAPPPANPTLKLRNGITFDRLYFGIQSRPMFTLVDVNLIKSMGFDHIKVLIDPATHKSGAGIAPASMATLKMNVDSALSSGLPVVVDIHPQPEFKHAEVGDPVEFENYLGFMNAFAQWLADHYSPHQIAFEFMTEPFANYADWTALQYRIWETVRAAMPDHTLILSGDQSGRLFGVLGLHPVNDSNVLYCFSTYDPFIFTLQGADWAEFAGTPIQYLKNVPYPASPEIIYSSLTDMLASVPAASQGAAWQGLHRYGEQAWNADVLNARFKRLTDWNNFFGGRLQLWCGEFGCLGPGKGGVKPADRYAFIADVRRALETNGIWWAYWSYNETFTALLPVRVRTAPLPSASWKDESMLDALGLAGARNSLSLSGTDWKIHEDPSSQGAEQKFFDAELTAPGWIAAERVGTIALGLQAGHHDHLVETQAGGFVHGAGVTAGAAEVLLGAGDEEGAALVDAMPSGEVKVAAIHDVERTGFPDELVEDVHITHAASGDNDDGGKVALEGQQGVEFDGGLGAEANTLAIYVAPGGNDGWTGGHPSANWNQTNGPLATLPRALEKSRAARRDAPGTEIRIVLRGGEYGLDRPLVFRPEDSGLTVTAYPRETPVLTSEARLTGWHRSAVNPDLWEAQAPAGWQFHELFVNGVRRGRARLPATGFYHFIGDPNPIRDGPAQLRFHPGDVKEQWAREGGVDLVVLEAWSQTRNRICAVDTTSNVVSLAGNVFPNYIESDGRFYIENVPEGLRPGQWRLEEQSGRVTYWPEPGEDVLSAKITVPRLYYLARLKGEEDRPVHDIVFHGLVFSGTDWRFYGWSDVDFQAAVEVEAAIQAQFATQCAFTQCRFNRLGGYAVDFGHGCQSNKVVGCQMFDLGGGGVRLGDTEPEAARKAPNTGNCVTDNHIYNIGLVNAPAVGVLVLLSANNLIAHNEIDHTFYTAISVGWSWGYDQTPCQGNIIEFNHLHDIGQGMLSDMGGIYTLGVQPGTIVRGNRIHDVNIYIYGGWGLYTDEGSSGIVLVSNIVYRCQSAGFHHHYGASNLLYNNIFALNHDSQLWRTRAEAHLSFTFTNNIVYFSSGSLLGGNWSGDRYDMDHNIYFDTRVSPSHPPLDGVLKFEDWRRRGHDIHSLFADPLFVEPAKGDFRLRRGSPAMPFGFHAFDLHDAGVRKKFARP